MQTINLTLLATTLQQYKNLTALKEKAEIHHFHLEQCESIFENINNILPSGSGFNLGATFNAEKSTYTKLIFDTEYNHIKNDMYDGWTKHKIIVTPEFGSYALHITGINRDQIKDYIAEVFNSLFTCTDYTTMIEQRNEMFDTKNGIYSPNKK